MLNSLRFECCFLSILVATLSVGQLVKLWRRNQFISAVGGLHANVFIFFGVGPFLYGLQVDVPERIWFEGVLLGISKTGWYFVMGYALLWSFRLPRSKYLFQPAITLGYIGLMAVAGVFGYWGTKMIFASSGIGTIFPVLKYFMYPALFLAVVNLDRRDLVSVVLAVGLLVVTLVFAFLSPWRSEFISLAVCLVLGRFFLRSRISLRLVFGVAILIWLFIPFLQLKKVDNEFVIRHPLSAIEESFSASIGERADLVNGLLAVRINAFREMGFVQHALDANLIDRRLGSSYVEALLQMVPRMFWPGKPSYNQTTNYLLARQLGLLSFEDPSTSWGVHAFAEFVWNFNAVWLLGFVPLVFWSVGMLDQFVGNRVRSIAGRTMVESVYFFQFMAVVGLIGTVTYVLWLPIAALGIERMAVAIGWRSIMRSQDR